MSESVSLPALGESVTEGTVTRWLKNVGDRVEVDEPLLEVSTDKVDTEIPSPVAGVIEQILVNEDETVEVGTALVTIGDGTGAGDAGDAAAPGSASDAPAESAPAGAAPAENAPAQSSPATEAPEAATEAPAAPTEAPAAPAAAGEAHTAGPDAPAAEVPSTEVEPESAGESAVVPPAPATPEPAPAAEQPAPPVPATAPSAPVPAASAAAAAAPAAAPTSSDSAQSAASGSDSSTSASSPAPESRRSHAGGGYVTPIVRKLAHDSGVDLDSVTGTGVGGRIRKQDILDASSASAESAEPDAASSAPAVEVSPLRGTTQPMSRLRKVVAERAVASMQASAQLTSVVEVDVSAVAALRDSVKAEFAQKTGNKLSFLPFFALAAAEALKTYPVVNATIDGDSIVYPDHENLSIAVDTERGLLTPVLRDAGEKNIAQLAGEIADLADRTRNNQLKPDELAGGTFTLTNTGSRGALFDTPVVFLPQVAILGTGIVTRKPVVVKVDGSDAIAIRSMVYLALSYDHRIVDGADAARFLVAVKSRLEAGDFAGSLGT